MTDTEKIQKLVHVLSEWTQWRPGVGMRPLRTPGHGPCCTCGDCGYHHDDCVCEHNAIEEVMQEILPQ